MFMRRAPCVCPCRGIVRTVGRGAQGHTVPSATTNPNHSPRHHHSTGPPPTPTRKHTRTRTHIIARARATACTEPAWTHRAACLTTLLQPCCHGHRPRLPKWTRSCPRRRAPRRWHRSSDLHGKVTASGTRGALSTVRHLSLLRRGRGTGFLALALALVVWRRRWCVGGTQRLLL